MVQLLTDTVNVNDYIKKNEKHDAELNSNWETIWLLAGMEAAFVKYRTVQAADIKGLLQIIQSIRSPKTKPFNQWLAQFSSY